MPNSIRDISALTHIKDYCDEIERTLSEIEFNRDLREFCENNI